MSSSICSCKCGSISMIAIDPHLCKDVKVPTNPGSSIVIGQDGINIKSLDTILFDPVSDGCFDITCKKCHGKFRIQIDKNLAICRDVTLQRNRRKSMARIQNYSFPIQLRKFVRIDQSQSSPMFLSPIDPRGIDANSFSLEGFNEDINEVDIDYDLMFSKTSEKQVCSFCDNAFRRLGSFL